MIGGFPHRPEDSFFEHAIQQLRTATGRNVVPSIFTFGGFPVTRVPRHLKARCLDAHPDIVVIQFASSDLVVPVHHHSGSSRPVHHEVSTQMPQAMDLGRWWLQGLIGEVRRLNPVTPLETYLQTLEQIVRALREHQIIPVVLSPFIFGARRSDRLARVAAGRLQTMLAALPGVVYVDAYSPLARQPRRKMLLKDGTHLSLAGQLVVAEALLPCLKTALQDWERSTPARV